MALRTRRYTLRLVSTKSTPLNTSPHVGKGGGDDSGWGTPPPTTPDGDQRREPKTGTKDARRGSKPKKTGDEDGDGDGSTESHQNPSSPSPSPHFPSPRFHNPFPQPHSQLPLLNIHHQPLALPYEPGLLRLPVGPRGRGVEREVEVVQEGAEQEADFGVGEAVGGC